MKKITMAAVMCSKAYQELIYSVLEENNVISVNFAENETESLHDFVKRNTSDISTYDALIIDLGVLSDTDEKIKESIGMIRYYDDKIRIIIFEGSRPNSYPLMHNCFLNGIYNLIIADTYINIRSNLEKCICEGMTYKDALDFRNEENLLKVAHAPLENEKKVIAFTGTQHRIGVTHCVISIAYTLRNYGYLVAVIDCTGTTDYLTIMKSYEQKLKENMSFTIDDIDFYIKSSQTDAVSPTAAYNFILYDFGLYGRVCALSESEQRIYKNAQEKIIVCGTKSWEIPYLSATLECLQEDKEAVKYLFNFSEEALHNDVKKMMKKTGVNEKQVFFMEFVELFQEVSMVAEMFGASRSKRKKGLFKRSK